jgi:hypothetical protein
LALANKAAAVPHGRQVARGRRRASAAEGSRRRPSRGGRRQGRGRRRWRAYAELNTRIALLENRKRSRTITEEEFKEAGLAKFRRELGL